MHKSISILFLGLAFFSQSAMAQSRVETIVLRLKPGQDVLKEIDEIVHAKKIEAASIVSAVGSLKTASIRFADQEKATLLKGPFEIVSLTGTTGVSGTHLHIAVSDGQGKTLGGHLMEGNIIYTTLELALDVYPALKFRRTLDPTYGYKELDVQ